MIIVDDFSQDASKDIVSVLSKREKRIKPFFLDNNVLSFILSANASITRYLCDEIK